MRKLWFSGSSCGGLHDIQSGHEGLGIAPEEEDINQTEEHEFYSGLIIKIGARCFFAIKKAISEWTVICFGRQ